MKESVYDSITIEQKNYTKDFTKDEPKRVIQMTHFMKIYENITRNLVLGEIINQKIMI